MFSSNVLVGQPVGFFRGIGEHTLAFIAQGQVYRGRNLLGDRGVSFNLLADRFNRGMGAQETIGQGFVFAQQSEQQVLRFYIARPELARFVAGEKDDAPSFLCIAFEHTSLSPPSSSGRCRGRAKWAAS